jgi:hypothetical protein
MKDSINKSPEIDTHKSNGEKKYHVYGYRFELQINSFARWVILLTYTLISFLNGASYGFFSPLVDIFQKVSM